MIVMIHLLNLSGVFVNLPTDDVNINLMNFLGICTSYNLHEMIQDVIQLRLFQLSLTGEATLWLGELPCGSTTIWNDLRNNSKTNFSFPPEYINSPFPCIHIFKPQL